MRQVVFLSLRGVECKPFAPHFKVERSLRQQHIPLTSLRPSFFMQNLDTTHRADIRDEDQIFIFAGKGRTRFIDVRDIEEIGAKVLPTPSRAARCWTTTRWPPSSAASWGGLSATPGPRPAKLVGTCSSVGGRRPSYPQQQLGRLPRRMEEYVRDYAGCWARLGYTARNFWSSPTPA